MLPYILEGSVTANYFDFGDNRVSMQCTSQCAPLDMFVADMLQQAFDRRVNPLEFADEGGYILVTGSMMCDFKASYWAEFPLHFPIPNCPMGLVTAQWPGWGPFSPSPLEDLPITRVCPCDNADYIVLVSHSSFLPKSGCMCTQEDPDSWIPPLTATKSMAVDTLEHAHLQVSRHLSYLPE